MTELPDDELDKLFRKSSEEFDPQFEPEDWDVLKKRLDGHDGRTPAGWFRKWWPLGLLLLIVPVGITLYVSSKNNFDKKSAAIQNSTKQPEKSGANATNATEREYAAKDEAVSEPESLGNKNDLTATEKKAESTKVASNTTIGKKQSITDQRSITKTLPRSRSKAGGVYLEPDRSKTAGGDGAISFEKEEGVGEETEEGPSEEGLTMLDALEMSWNYSGRMPSVNLPALVTNDSLPAAEPVQSPKWAVRLGYSPDLTTVGFENFTKPGSAFSLLFEYGISKRLYLQAGVARSVKDYYAYAKDYELKKYVTKYNTPYGVDGECTMLEIPVGFRYDFSQKAHSKWFAGAGASSYYTQKEKYEYRYEKYVYGQVPGWEGKSGWFLFSHLNASVGYERSITRKLSILAEPYIRIPLKGVGYGKVNLLTTGMWLSLRYTPSFR